MLTDVEKERQRCIRCVDLLLAMTADGTVEQYLIRLRNQIANGGEPLTIEQQIEPERDADHRDN